VQASGSAIHDVGDHIASGAGTITPIQAAGTATINPLAVRPTIAVIGRVITQRINGRV